MLARLSWRFLEGILHVLRSLARALRDRWLYARYIVLYSTSPWFSACHFPSVPVTNFVNVRRVVVTNPVIRPLAFRSLKAGIGTNVY